MGFSSEWDTNAGGTNTDYLFADGERIGVRTRTTTPSVTTFQGFVSDHAGSVSVVTNSAGTVVQRLAYDAWGRRRNPNGTEDPTGAITAPTSRGYTDHEHLPGGVNGIHLINMNARLYDPELGRFLSADTIIPDPLKSQALNRYSYVYNNPGSYTDPTGHCPVECTTYPTGNPYIDIALAIYNVLDSFGLFDEDRKYPVYYSRGLAGTNEDLRQATPLYGVVRYGDGSLGQRSNLGTSFGGSKYAFGFDSGAAEYTDGGRRGWFTAIHLFLNGVSVGLDATVIGAAVSWIPDLLDAGVSVVEGDLAGATISVGATIPGIGIGGNAAKIARTVERARPAPVILPGPGQVTNNPVNLSTAGRSANEAAAIREYARRSNRYLDANGPQTIQSTAGSLRGEASAAARAERLRAARAGQPYSGQAGHVPDTAVTGQANPPGGWLDMPGASNQVCGGALGCRVGETISGYTVDGVRP